jgi:hypothetical protein
MRWAVEIEAKYGAADLSVDREPAGGGRERLGLGVVIETEPVLRGRRPPARGRDQGLCAADEHERENGSAAHVVTFKGPRQRAAQGS